MHDHPYDLVVRSIILVLDLDVDDGLMHLGVPCLVQDLDVEPFHD